MAARRLTDMTPLRGMPLVNLQLSGCEQIKDLTPFQGLPLTALNLQGCHGIKDSVAAPRCAADPVADWGLRPDNGLDASGEYEAHLCVFFASTRQDRRGHLAANEEFDKDQRSAGENVLEKVRCRGMEQVTMLCCNMRKMPVVLFGTAGLALVAAVCCAGRAQRDHQEPEPRAPLRRPIAAAFVDDGRTLCVANQRSGTVSLVDIRHSRVLEEIGASANT